MGYGNPEMKTKLMTMTPSTSKSVKPLRLQMTCTKYAQFTYFHRVNIPTLEKNTLLQVKEKRKENDFLSS